MKPDERLQYIINNEGLNAKNFAEKIGFERPQVIYDVLKCKTKTITENLATKILSAFPSYSKVWLLTGEGEPNSSEKNITIVGNNHNISSNNVNSDIAVKELIHQLDVKDATINRLLGIIEKTQK